MKDSFANRCFVTRRDFLRLSGIAATSSLMARVTTAEETPAPKIVCRIALIADTHATRGVERDQAKHKARFERVIAQVNAANVDLVLLAGDLAENGKSEEFADFQTQSLALRAPQLCVPGNHDIGGKPVANANGTLKISVSDQRLDRFEAHFGASFWMKELAKLRVVGFNASLLGSGLKRESEQWEFIEKTLAQSAPFPTVLMTHYPPFYKERDEPGDYWNLEPQPRARLLKLLPSGGVRAVVSGHLHRPIVMQHEGIAFVTAPAVSFGLPRERQSVGWALLTVSSQGEKSKSEVQTELRAVES